MHFKKLYGKKVLYEKSTANNNAIQLGLYLVSAHETFLLPGNYASAMILVF